MYHNVNILNFENLEPCYLKMNPAGVVPTLKHGYNIIPELDEILKYLDVHFSSYRILFTKEKSLIIMFSSDEFFEK